MAHNGYTSSGPYDQVNKAAQSQPPTVSSTDYVPPSSSTSSASPHPAHHYDPDRMNMRPPKMPVPSQQPLGQSSNPPGNIHHQTSINDAVNSAFDQANTPAYLSPEVVSQITANVIQQLKVTGLDNISSPQPQQTPSQYQTQPQQWSHASTSPVPPRPDSSPARTAHNGGSAQRSNIAEGDMDDQTYPTPTGYSTSPQPPPEAQSERPENPPSPDSDESPNREFRPRCAPRTATFVEMTTLERIWGQLFEDGKPTERLGQFLRGVAVHLIEDYPPGDTLVVLPEKMQRFYDDTHVESDTYPWQEIFDDQTSSISRMFRDAEAEHHLVQEHHNERPDIPGLTPRGFQRWATLMIQAYPEREYERLQKAVLDMPVSNPDDKKERFPKEIPRRLFPDAPNLLLREKLDECIMRHCHLELPVAPEDAGSARRSQAPGSQVPTETDPSVIERGRQPYAASSTATTDNEEESKSPRPIERERKPYAAQPGGGKVYNESTSTRGHAGSFSTGPRPKADSISSSRRRPSEAYIPEAQAQAPHYRTAASSARRPTVSGRSRSSSRSMHAHGHGDYRHTESDRLDRDSVPRYSGAPAGEYYFDPSRSNLPGDMVEDSRRYRDLGLDVEDRRFQESIREREREREKGRYHEHHPYPHPHPHPHRQSWVEGGEYYRGMLGGQGGGPAGY